MIAIITTPLRFLLFLRQHTAPHAIEECQLNARMRTEGADGMCGTKEQI
jgi:hypothetical protein